MQQPQAMTLDIRDRDGHPGPDDSAADSGFPDVFVARQPIFDRRTQVYGYELLFRTGLENFCPQDDLDHAAASVLENAWLTFGLPALIGTKKAFINFTRSLLVGGYGLSLPPPSFLLQSASCPRRFSFCLAPIRADRMGYSEVF